MLKSKTSALDVADQINNLMRERLQAGKRVSVTGEEETNHFHGAKSFGDDMVEISYGSKRITEPKRGRYGACISSANALRLLSALTANKASFRCSDEDEEPFSIRIS